MRYTIKDGRFAHSFNTLGEALRAMRGMPRGSRLYNHEANKEIHKWQSLLRLELYAKGKSSTTGAGRTSKAHTASISTGVTKRKTKNAGLSSTYFRIA
jgi:hypothetical protein